MGAQSSSSVAASQNQYTPLANVVAATINCDDNDDNSDGLCRGREDSDDESWPTSSTRYAPIGDPNSKIASRGSSRLAREFTMGTGFHHLTHRGNAAMFDAPEGSVLPTPSVVTDGDKYYSDAAIELMQHHGLSHTGLVVRNSSNNNKNHRHHHHHHQQQQNTYLRKILLVTDAPHSIKIYIGNEDGPCVVGMAFVRDEIVFTSGVLSETDFPALTLELDPDRPIIDSIELQSCTWLVNAADGGNEVEKKISYLKISCGSNNQGMVFGEVHPPGFDGAKSIYAPPEHASGRLCISAIGYFDHRPISLQVVDLGSDCSDVVDAMDTNVYYDKGVISGNIARSRRAEVEFLGSITTDRDHVWEVLEGCMDAIENSNPCHGELLPNAVDLLEEALGGDIEAIHSVLRMDRFLTHVIQQQQSIHTFRNKRSNFYAKLIPLKQMWGIFSNTIERIKRVNSYQPVMNAFNVAFLKGTDDFFRRAVFIYLTQVTLLLLTIGHVYNYEGDLLDSWFPLKLLTSVCGTIVVNFIARNYKSNFHDFLTIFPEYSGTALCRLDALSNVFGGVLVVFCTFFMLLMTDNNLDVVLNATALLFVLELDELMVDTNPIYMTSLYRAYFMKTILKDLNESDERYWDPSYLRKNRGEHYRIHLPTCSLFFPAKQQ